jgi:hypothetical protein
MILLVSLLTVTAACDPLHAPIYNLTSCPIEIVTSITKFPDSIGAEVQILPGKLSGVFGGFEPVRYNHIVIKDFQNKELSFGADVLSALRPPQSEDDRWGYFPEGLRFLRSEPSQQERDELAKARCAVPGSPNPSS